jgi:HK97 family phage prohead protease
MTMERRALSAPIEVRGESRTIAGYAATFMSEAVIGNAFREQIAPGAFSGAIGADVRALFDHDPAHVLGRTTSGTLRLSEDERGLAVEIDLPDTQVARDLRESMARGDIDGMSFGFRVTEDEWDRSGKMPLRTVRALELFEVSVVAFPAYADTEIGLRSLSSWLEQKQHNAAMAQARIAQRKAEMEQKFRRI